ncbi:MAG: type II CAAX endopeptidase family protein [Candidatus Micrarchaeia archaeon]
MRAVFLALAVLSILAFAAVLGCSFLRSCGDIVILGSASIHLALISSALFMLWKKDLRSTLDSIGFPGSLKSSLVYTAIGLCAIFSMLLIVGMLSIVLGFNDQQKVTDKVAGLPPVLLVLAVAFAPLSEELFFRAFLSPRAGIVASSLLFSVVHFTYGSVIEVVGVFFVGLLLASVYRMSRSITPCVLTHMAYNLLSISVMLLLGGRV